MSELRTFVDEIKTTLKSIGPADFVHNGNPCSSPDIVIFRKCNLEQMRQTVTTLLGNESVEQFYRDCEPKGAASKLELVMSLVKLLSACCTIVPGVRVAFDDGQFLEGLTHIAECVQAGDVPYTVSVRMTNIDIDADCDLGDGIHFHKLPPQVIQAKYPIERTFSYVPTMVEQHWLNHCVEAVISGRATPSQLQQWHRIEHEEAMVNSILHSFLLAAIPANARPSITHIILDSPLQRECFHHGIGQFSFQPAKLTPTDIVSLKKTYRFLQDIKNDRVLQTSVDRFILGKKRGEHHPNRINEPNWDKVVDYVIAMETLFLTVNGNPAEQELSYRFRLNGSSLLNMATGNDTRQTFQALNHLYTLRSKVVHGCEERAVVKAANKFIECLGIDNPNYRHSLGRLMLLSRKVEEWLQRLLFYVNDMSMPERPYKKVGGWEDILWKVR